MRMGVRRHDGGQFPAQRLLIRPPFAGHDDVGFTHHILKPRLLQDDLHAALQFAAEELPEREAEPSRGANARKVRIAFRDGGEMRKGASCRI